MRGDSFSFTVFGVVPATQGSKKYVGTRRTASGANIPLIVESHPGLPKFRQAIADAIQVAMSESKQEPFEGAVKVTATFYLPKPKTVKLDLPIGSRTGDLDKYLRALLDSITKGGLWGDDCQVVEIEAYKRWATDLAGVAVTVSVI